jgi:hypothetical protein
MKKTDFMSRKELEQKLAGAITDELKKAGKSLWKKIVGPSDEDRLNTITSNFISEALEKHSTAEVEEILLSVPEHILGNVNSDTLAAIDKTAFSPKNLYRACHVGSVILSPKSLYVALHGLWRYAKIKNHESDGLFRTDGRAHLILAITAMTGKVFSIKDPDKKESWLNLLNIFLSETMKSDLVKSKNWNKDETFFKVLNHLKNTIKKSINDCQRDRTKHDVRLYLDGIAQKTEACQEYMRTVLPMLYENESSIIIDGRPKIKDLDGTFIAYLLDTAGFVLPEDKDYLDQVIEDIAVKEEKDHQIEKIEKQEHIEGTEKLMSTIMTLTVDAKSLETYYAEHESRHKMALFIMQLDDLVKKTSQFPRIELNKNSEIELLVKESAPSPNRKLEEKVKVSVLYKLKSGIGARYLTISTSQKDKEKIQIGEAAHRRKIMNFEVEKIRIINAVSNLLKLCEKSSKLYQHFGEAHGALLLQRLFPSIGILISAGIRSQENIEKISEELSSANQALRTKILEGETFIKLVKECLQSIEKSTNHAHDRNKFVLQGLINQEISLKKDLEEITHSLRSCTNLFTMSRMLKKDEEKLLQKNIENMILQLEPAEVLDAGYTNLARDVQKQGALTIESFQKLRAPIKSSIPMLVEKKSEENISSEFATVFSAFKAWELPKWENENQQGYKEFEKYIQSFGFELASSSIPVGLCTAVFEQIQKNKKFLSFTFEEFQQEILEYIFNHVEELHGISGNLYTYFRKELESNSEWINQTILKAIVKCRPISILIISDDQSKKIYKQPRFNQIDVFIACFKAKFYSSASLTTGKEIHSNIKKLFQKSLDGNWHHYPDSSIQKLNLPNAEVKSVGNFILTKEFIESLVSHWTITYPFLKTISLSFHNIKLGESYIPENLCDEKEANDFFLTFRSSFMTYMTQDFKPHDFAVKISKMTDYSISNDDGVKLFLYRIVKFSQLFYILNLRLIDWEEKAQLLTMVKKEIHHTFITAMCLNACFHVEKGKQPRQVSSDTPELNLLINLLTRWNKLLIEHENDLLERKQNKVSETHKIGSLSSAKELPQMSITNSSGVKYINLNKITLLCDDTGSKINKLYNSISELLALIQKFFDNLLSSLRKNRNFSSLPEQAQFKEKIVRICGLISQKLKSIEGDNDYPLSSFFEQIIKNLDVPDPNKPTLVSYLVQHIHKKIIPFLEEQRKECLTVNT